MAVFLSAGGGERTRPLFKRAPAGAIITETLRPPTPHRPVIGVGRPPGDERGFVHKRIFGGIKGLVTGGPIAGLAGFLGGGGQAQPTSIAAIPSRISARCPPGFFETPAGGCQPLSQRVVKAPGIRGVAERFIPGGRTGFITEAAEFDGRVEDFFGEARVGRFGAGLEPFAVDRRTLKCPTGSVLGKVEADGSFLCYNKRDISNKERKWPRGRRPLLTGGDMRCISVASSAAKKLQRKQKQLTELGLLKRPASGSTALIKAKAELEAIKSAHYAGS